MSLRGVNFAIPWRFRKTAIPLLIASPLLPPIALPERPIFIIGCPRSGTSLLFRLLRRAPGATSLGQEGHVLWETFHHPRAKGWSRGNHLDASDVGTVERRYIAWAIRRLSGDRGKFVEKTPRNVFRLEYLDALFPDARYVFLHRDGRAIVGSLYGEWTKKGATPPQLLPKGFAVEGLPERVWWFVLPPGWSECNRRPLEEVCAFQYTSSLEAMLSFMQSHAEGRITEVRFEDLCADPAMTLRSLATTVDLSLDQAWIDRAVQEVRPQTGVPKWQARYPVQIDRILPQIEPTMRRVGYLV